MNDVMRIINQIDRQHNGYVTVTELDDILKLTFKDELENKDTRLIMRKYASI
jgi:Ca2+-binding EF-hand superfamily protein